MTSSRIILFGITREIVGQDELPMEVDGSSVAELKERLKGEYPDLGTLQYLAVAVNEEYANDDTIVHADDTIALIPPVSGG